MKKSFLLSATVAVLLFVFNSCENFMEGRDIKEQLDEQIEYYSDKNHLAVVSVSPSYNLAGSYCDTPILITFNQPVKQDTFGYSIVSGNNDYSSCYEKPEFFQNGSVVKLSVKRDKISLFGISKGDVKDFTLTVSETTKGLSGSSKEKESKSYTYRLNSNTDSTPPEFLELYFAKTKEEAENAGKGIVPSSLTLTGFDEWEEADFYKNHVRSVWVYCKAMDNESGLQGFSGSELLQEDTEGTKIGITEKYSTGSENVFKAVPGTTGVYEAVFEYKFVSSKDGVVKINLLAMDANGNVSEENREIYLIKDTFFLENNNIRISNISMDNSWILRDKNRDSFYHSPYGGEDPYALWGETEDITSISDFNKYAGNFVIENVSADSFYKSYKSKITASISVGKTKDEYMLVDTTEEYVIDPLGNDTGNMVLQIPEDVMNDYNHDWYVKVIVCDEIGNSKDVEALLPVSPVPTRFSNLSTRKPFTVWYRYVDIYYTNYSSYPGVKNYGVEVYPDTDRLDKLKIGGPDGTDNGVLANLEINNGNSDHDNYFAMFSYYSTGNAEICGLIRPSNYLFIDDDKTDADASLPEIQNVDIKYDSNTHKLTTVVHLKNLSEIKNYDSVYLECTYYNPDKKIQSFYLNEKTTAVTIDFDSPCIPNLDITGISEAGDKTEGYIYSQKESDKFSEILSIDLTGPILSSLEYGEPNVYTNTMELGYARDYESGVLLNKNGKVDYTIWWTEYSSSWTSETEDRPVEEIKQFKNFTIEEAENVNPVVDMSFLRDGSYLVYYSASDKLGNTTYKCLGKIDRIEVPMPQVQKLSDAKIKITFDAKSTSASIWDNNLMISAVNSENEWEDLLDYSMRFESVSNGICVFEHDEQSEKFTGNYVRVFVEYESRIVDYGRQCNLPVPLYAYVPDGVKYTDTNCTYRNVVPGLNGYTVLSDRPSVAQIIYNKENLGEVPDSWEKYTVCSQKIQPKVIDGTGEYKPDITKVPYGYYYVVIFHFSDGTSVMSPVYQK